MKALAVLALAACDGNYRFEDVWTFVDTNTVVRPNLHDRLFEAFDDSGARIAASMGKDDAIGEMDLAAVPPFLMHETGAGRNVWEAVVFDVGVEQDKLAGRSDAEPATTDQLILSFDGATPPLAKDFWDDLQFECFGTGDVFQDSLRQSSETGLAPSFAGTWGPSGAHVCDPAKGDQLVGYHLQNTDDDDRRRRARRDHRAGRRRRVHRVRHDFDRPDRDDAGIPHRPHRATRRFRRPGHLPPRRVGA